MRTIFHVDVNSAFLSWSALKQLKENPDSVDLRTIPSAVGGDVETRHGIITAKSIPAKKYGIRTGEPVVKALAKCPDLVLVKSDFAVYRDYSSRLMELLREYTPVLQQASIDEAYLDVTELLNISHRAADRSVASAFIQNKVNLSHRTTDNDDISASVHRSQNSTILSTAYSDKDGTNHATSTWNDPESLAREIADHVKKSLGFTVNVGISSNKFLAKMASDFQKPDKIHTLWPEEIPAKMWPLPIGKLYGCGKATAARLQNLGIYTIGDAAAADLSLLQGNLGQKAGLYILERANGRDNSEVHSEERDAKSYSNETTTAEDITRDNYDTLALPILKKLSEKVSGRLQRDNVWGSTVSVIVKTGAFRRHTRQTTLNLPTNDAGEIYTQSQALLYDLMYGKRTGTDRTQGLFSQGDVLRLIGVGVSNLDNGENRQMDLFEWARMNESNVKQKERNDKLNDMMSKIKNKYGEDAIRRGK